MRDHLRRLLHVGVGAIPLLLWFRDPSSAGGWGLLLALLMWCRIWHFDLRLRVLLRYLQGQLRVQRAKAFLLWGAAFVLWPDAWLGDFGPGQAVLSAPAVIVTLALLLITALGCVQELRAWPDVRGGPLPLPGVIWTLRYVSGRGWVAPLLVTTHPGAHGLLPAAILVTASELALSWYAARTGDWASRVAGALRLPSANSFQVPYGQANVVGTWAYDSVVRHPEQPDLAPWELFLRHDEVLAHHPLCKGVVRDWQKQVPFAVTDAEPWVTAAEAYASSLGGLFLFHVANEHIPMPARRQLFTTWQTVAAMTALARAEVSVAAGLLDNAVRNRRSAAEQFAEAGLPINAATARCLAADLLVFELDRTEEALAELHAMGDRSVLPPAVQRLAELVMSVADKKRGHLDGRRRFRPLQLGAADALFEELPTWIPFLSIHHREIAFVQYVEQRVQHVAHLLDLELDVELGSLYRHFADRRYNMPLGYYMRQALADSQEAYRLGNFQNAAVGATYVLDDARTKGDLVLQQAAHRLLAQIAGRRGEWSKQYSHLTELVVCAEATRDRVTDADVRIDVDIAGPCAELVALIVDRRVPDVPLVKALDMAERGRARLLLETVGGAYDIKLPEELGGLQETERELLRSVRNDDRFDSHGPFGFPNLNPFWGEVTRTNLQQTWAEIKETGPIGAAYVNARRGIPAEYAQLRSLLGPGDVLCEFVCADDRTMVLLVRHDLPEPVVVDLPLKAAALSGGRSRIGEPSPSWTAELQPLAEALAERTKPGEVLWMVPDGPLHDVPLHAVTVHGAPWGERNPMSCTPSASLMHYHRRVPGARTGVERALILADSRSDLPHAAAEARAVGATLPSADIYLGAAASSGTLRERLKQTPYDVVHLACHCRLDEKRPSRSGILLADGELTAEDLGTMRLDARLIVLSGCDTGVQEQRRGSELMGLTRQFLQAGARSVLVTQWQVDDISTALLMDDFYQRLMDGSPVAAALSAARRRLRTMSLAQALEHCERERKRATDPRSDLALRHDMARLKLRAGHVDAAREDITSLLAGAPPKSPLRKQLLTLNTQAHYATSRRDGHRPAFDHPYYWAPFMLVGDWR